MGKLDLTNYNAYQAGRFSASDDMKGADFDIESAILSFDTDPAESPFQHGYLRELKGSYNG